MSDSRPTHLLFVPLTPSSLARVPACPPAWPALRHRCAHTRFQGNDFVEITYDEIFEVRLPALPDCRRLAFSVTLTIPLFCFCLAVLPDKVHPSVFWYCGRHGHRAPRRGEGAPLPPASTNTLTNSHLISSHLCLVCVCVFGTCGVWCVVTAGDAICARIQGRLQLYSGQARRRCAGSLRRSSQFLKAVGTDDCQC